MNLPELIKRLRRRYTMSMVATRAMLYDTMNGEREEAAEALEQLVAALAAKDEALALARKEFEGLPHSLGYEFTHVPKIDAAIALQPHAELVAKMKSDAIEWACERFEYYDGSTYADEVRREAGLPTYADRIERGEVK